MRISETCGLVYGGSKSRDAHHDRSQECDRGLRMGASPPCCSENGGQEGYYGDPYVRVQGFRFIKGLSWEPQTGNPKIK